MGGRITAVKRILLILPAIIYTYGFAILLYLLFIPYAVLDVLVQLIIGGDGIPGGSWVAGVFQWHIDNTKYLMVGEGDWQWVP